MDSTRALDCSFTRRTLLRSLGAGGAAVAANAVAGLRPAAAAETLTLMTVGGSWGDSIRKLIAEPYAQKHNLSLAWDNRPNAQQVAAIRAMRGRPAVDAVEVGGPHMAEVIDFGLVNPINPALVPNFKRVYPVFKNKYWAARSVAPFVLTFNKNTVSKTQAEQLGWKLLLDPKLRGRVAIPKFAWMGEMWLNGINISLGGTYENMRPAVDLARGVMKTNNGKVMASNDDGLTMFTTGEIWAAPFWTGRTYELADKGIAVDFVYPQGWAPYTFGFVSVKGNRQDALVQGFIDYSLSPEVQLAVAKQFSYLPTLPLKTGNPRLEINKADVAKAANIDWFQAAKYSDRNLQMWEQQILG